jgi:prevent-host-death family protein
MSAAATSSIDEADANLADLLDRAERGEEVTINRHGRPVASLVPAPPAHDVAKALRAVQELAALREKLRAESGPTTTDEILDLIREGRKY